MLKSGTAEVIKINPFSLTFGRVPISVISREKQFDEIIQGITGKNPEFQVCMLTGVRGAGKTVFMTEIAAEISTYPDWTVVDLNIERNLLHSLAAELSNRKELLQIFIDAKLNLSILGIDLQIDSAPSITDITAVLDSILKHLTKKDKKVLITIDETVSNKNLREFTSQFQIYMRRNYNVFLLMTGLYENIKFLQDEKSLTFLYRAPKFAVTPLNATLIAKQYKKIFSVTNEESRRMAELVKGYPYAYQVLGYLCYKKQCPYHQVIEEFDAYLAEYVYDKL